MPDDKSIMKVETTLPRDFTGVFYFTNPTKTDFVGKWGGKEYIYPAMTTSPMVIPEHSPLEIQHIRKKFAKDLAEREFFNSDSYELFRKQEGSPNNRTMSGIHQAAAYTIHDLTPFIQKCLQPLEPSKALVQEAKRRDVEGELHRDEDGNLVTAAIDKKTSLRDKALSNTKLVGN